MATKLIPATAGQWVDFRNSGKPLSWYQAVKAQGVVGVFIDSATGGYGTDVDYALWAGLQVQLFQGYYDAMWDSVSTATSQGHRMVTAAQYVKSPQGMTCWLDAEGMPSGMSGTAWLDWVNAWSQIVNQAGYNCGIYLNGPYPVTSAQLYTNLPYIHHYWHGISAMTPPVATRGYTVSQNQVNVGLDGHVVDWDTVYRDQLHQLPFAMVSNTVGTPTTSTPSVPDLAQVITDLNHLSSTVGTIGKTVGSHAQTLNALTKALDTLIQAAKDITIP